MMKRTTKLISTTLLYLAFTASQAVALPDRACLEPALADELQSKLDFQDNWAVLVATQRPELTEPANMQAATSKLAFERRLSRVLWLLEIAPNRFESADDVWALDWSDEDQAAWLTADFTHQALQDTFDEARSDLRTMPNADAFRTFLYTANENQDFVRLGEAFAETNGVLRNAVAGCFQS